MSRCWHRKACASACARNFARHWAAVRWTPKTGPAVKLYFADLGRAEYKERTPDERKTQKNRNGVTRKPSHCGLKLFHPEVLHFLPHWARPPSGAPPRPTHRKNPTGPRPYSFPPPHEGSLLARSPRPKLPAVYFSIFHSLPVQKSVFSYGSQKKTPVAHAMHPYAQIVQPLQQRLRGALAQTNLCPT